MGTKSISGLRPKRNFVPGARNKPSMMMASHLNSGSSDLRFCFFSGGRISQSTSRAGEGFRSRLTISVRAGLSGNSLQHLSVGWEFFHEHEQTLNRFLRFVSGEPPTDKIDFLQLPWLQEQLFAARPGEENINSRINALVADFAIEHHLHISRAVEFLKDQFIHAAAGFD